MSACGGEHQWSKGFGGTTGYNSSSAVSVDATGNVFVAGSFSGSVDFGGGALNSAGLNDIFIAKFNARGNHLWSKRFGDVNGDHSTAITIDATGNLLVTGYFYSSSLDFGGGALNSAGLSEIFVAKFDAVGNHLWSKRFGDTSLDRGTSITVDATGNVLVTGYFAGSVDFGGGVLNSGGQDDIFIAKFDSIGNHLWSKRFGDTGDSYSTSITVDATRNVLVTGHFGGSIDLGGGVLESAGADDIFIAKFDLVGNHLWSKRFGDTSNDKSFCIIVDSTSNVLATGFFQGSVDFGGEALNSMGGSSDIFIAEFDADGNHLWSKSLGGMTYDLGDSVAVDATGNVLVTGYFYSDSVDFGGGGLNNAGHVDMFIAKFDSGGNHLWSERFGDAGQDEGRSVAVDAVGNTVVSGFMEEGIGGGFAGDIFLLKLAP